jgi:hypothetical protein
MVSFIIVSEECIEYPCGLNINEEDYYVLFKKADDIYFNKYCYWIYEVHLDLDDDDFMKDIKIKHTNGSKLHYTNKMIVDNKYSILDENTICKFNLDYNDVIIVLIHQKKLYLIDDLIKTDQLCLNGNVSKLMFKKLSLEEIIMLYNKSESINWNHALGSIFENGRLDLLRWIHENDIITFRIKISQFLSALSNGHVDLIKYVIEAFDITPKEKTIDLMVKQGIHDIEILTYLHNSGRKINYKYAVHDAASTCNMAALNWFLECGYEIKYDHSAFNDDLLEYPAENIMEVLVWFVKNGFELRLRNKFISGLFGKNNTELIDFVYENVSNFDIYYYSIILGIAKSGSVKLFDWMQSRGFEIKYSNRICETAGCFGNINVLQWLADNKFKINSYHTINRAIKNNNSIVLEWFIQRPQFKFRYSDGVTYKLGKYSDTNTLQWFIDHPNVKFKYDRDLFRKAVKHNNTKVLDIMYNYAISKNPNDPNDHFLFNDRDAVIESESVKLMKWFINHPKIDLCGDICGFDSDDNSAKIMKYYIDKLLSD